MEVGMFAVTGRRSLVVAAIACAGMGAGGVTAVQAGASGGGTAPSPAAPSTSAAAAPQPPIRPRTISGALRAAASATNAHCGQTITASLTLNGDLYCTGAGLTVTGTSVVLNLGGHQIAGPETSGSYAGVTLAGKSETVENGVVTHFYRGVYVTGATDTVLSVRATYEALGIDDHGTGTKITNSVAASNTYGGIYAINAAGGIYSGDHELSNGGDGLVIATANLTVTGNIANENTYDGIYDLGFETTLTKNTANFNADDGIYVGDATAIDGGGNLAKGNDYATGATPEQCHAVVCS
jgi:parallel beta-helix repeat protein